MCCQRNRNFCYYSIYTFLIFVSVNFTVFYPWCRTLDEHFLAGPSHYQPGHFIVPPHCYRSAPPCRTPFLWAFLMSQISREIPNLSLASDHCAGQLGLSPAGWNSVGTNLLDPQQPRLGYKLNCLLLWLAINNQPTLRNFGYPQNCTDTEASTNCIEK